MGAKRHKKAQTLFNESNFVRTWVKIFYISPGNVPSSCPPRKRKPIGRFQPFAGRSFCSLPKVLKVSRALLALEIPADITATSFHLHCAGGKGKHPQRSQFSLTGPSACGTYQLLSEDLEEVFWCVLCQEPFRVVTLGLCDVPLANTLSAPVRLSLVDC